MPTCLARDLHSTAEAVLAATCCDATPSPYSSPLWSQGTHLEELQNEPNDILRFHLEAHGCCCVQAAQHTLRSTRSVVSTTAMVIHPDHHARAMHLYIPVPERSSVHHVTTGVAHIGKYCTMPPACRSFDLSSGRGSFRMSDLPSNSIFVGDRLLRYRSSHLLLYPLPLLRSHLHTIPQLVQLHLSHTLDPSTSTITRDDRGADWLHRYRHVQMRVLRAFFLEARDFFLSLGRRRSWGLRRLGRSCVNSPRTPSVQGQSDRPHRDTEERGLAASTLPEQKEVSWFFVQRL